MSVSRITLSRKRFIEVLGEHKRITFSDLKKLIVGKGDSRMNLATLYRIVEAFESEGLIHQIEIAGERVIFPCQCEHATKEDAISITFCENCGAIYDTHVKLVSPYTSSVTYARIKNCQACLIR